MRLLLWPFRAAWWLLVFSAHVIGWIIVGLLLWWWLA